MFISNPVGVPFKINSYQLPPVADFSSWDIFGTSSAKMASIYRSAPWNGEVSGGIFAYHLYVFPLLVEQKAERQTELANWRPSVRPDNLVRGKWIDKGLPDCGLPDGNCWLARHADITWSFCRGGSLFETQGAGRCPHRFVHAGGHRSVAVWTLYVESYPPHQ